VTAGKVSSFSRMPLKRLPGSTADDFTAWASNRLPKRHLATPSGAISPIDVLCDLRQHLWVANSRNPSLRAFGNLIAARERNARESLRAAGYYPPARELSGRSRSNRWLTKTFGFREHYRCGDAGGPIGGAQIYFGNACSMLKVAKPGSGSPAQLRHGTQGLTVFVDDVEVHFQKTNPPAGP
jgi:hypothetical protein